MSSDRGRIVKNSLYLYFRMILIVVVSLYSSRVLLQTLGVVDLGIYNVVAGAVSTLVFFSSGLSNANQKLLAEALVSEEPNRARYIFSQCISVLSVFALVILALGIIIGFSVVDYLNIPQDRKVAALVVFCSNVGVFSLMILITGFQSLILIKEKMSAYTYLTVFEVVNKLLIALSIKFFSSDSKLITYGLLLLLAQVLLFVGYTLYCRLKFTECRISWVWNKSLVREILSFVGFNAFGGLAVSSANQGVNVLMNLFFGPVINAANGIANMVYGAVVQFVNSVINAAKPQILKDYALGRIESMLSLVCAVSKYSYFLMLLIVLPIYLNLEYIFSLWLGSTYPVESIVIVRVLLIQSLMGVFAQPLWVVANASGKIKSIQVYGRMITLSILPLSYISLTIRQDYTIPFMIAVICEVGYWFYCLYDIKQQIDLNIRDYIKLVIRPVFTISLFSLLIYYGISFWVTPHFLFVIASTAVLCFLNILIMYLCGLTSAERAFIKSKLPIKK